MDSTPGPSSASSASAGRMKYRKCDCGARMSSDKYDKHSTCSTCRGRPCSLDTRCPECADWSEDFFRLYSLHAKSLGYKRTYKLKVRKSKISGQSANIAPVILTPPPTLPISVPSSVIPIAISIPSVSESASESSSAILRKSVSDIISDCGVADTGDAQLETPCIPPPLSGGSRDEAATVARSGWN